MPKRYVVFLAASSALAISTCIAQAQRSSTAAAETLKRFLQTFDDDKTTRYVAAFSDLDGDGQPEAIVHLISKDWCGSGGCITLILRQNGGSWGIITKITITRPPIRVLNSTSHGWHNLSVWVQGGGIQPGYEAELRFNGKTYPRNPSIPPARSLASGVAGEVGISSSAAEIALYP
jgi:hypothetical protein